MSSTVVATFLKKENKRFYYLPVVVSMNPDSLSFICSVFDIQTGDKLKEKPE